MKRRTMILTIAGAVVFAFGAGVGIMALAKGGDQHSALQVTATSATTSISPSAAASATPSSSPSALPSVSDTPAFEATAPAATQTPASSLLPVPAFGSLGSATEVTLFDRVTILKPRGWSGHGGDSDSQSYADMTVCAMSTADCPYVNFVSLKSGPNKVNYGTNPIKTWQQNVCSGRPDAVQGPESFDAGGEQGSFYKLPCRGADYYAWYVPSQGLLVIAGDANSFVVSAEIVQAVMQRISW